MEKNIENYYDNLIIINDDFYEKIIFSLNLIPVLNLYYVSFNGGKDCLAAYILIKFKIFCIEYNLDYKNKENFEKFSKEKFYTKKIILLYFVNDNHFEEEENYVINFIKNEKVFINYYYSSYVEGLKFFLKKKNDKNDLIFMGTRIADNNNLDENIKKISKNLIENSTKPFPQFIRFYPVYNFNYSEIWKIILISKFDYLNLYDKGFSSIGKKTNTNINKNLINKFYNNNENNNNINNKYNKYYYPAWFLIDEKSEREFR